MKEESPFSEEACLQAVFVVLHCHLSRCESETVALQVLFQDSYFSCVRIVDHSGPLAMRAHRCWIDAGVAFIQQNRRLCESKSWILHELLGQPHFLLFEVRGQVLS